MNRVRVSGRVEEMDDGRVASSLKRWEMCVIGIWFLVFGALGWSFPRSGDDWAWGSGEGIRRLSSFFADYNGRYAGDLLIVGLMHSPRWVAPLVVSVVICAILILILNLSGFRTPTGYGLVTVLFFAMPLGVWRQTIVWLSGFTNYAVGGLFLLTFLTIARVQWFVAKRAVFGKLLLAFIVTLIGQLFMEHVTLCIFVLGLILTVAFRKSNGAWPPYLLASTAGGLVGAVIMFSNSAYQRAFSGGAGYQKTTRSLSDIASKMFGSIPANAIMSNVVLNIVLTVLCLTLVFIGPWRRALIGKAMFVAAPVFLGLTIWLAVAGGALSQRRLMVASTSAMLLILAVFLLSWRMLASQKGSPMSSWILLVTTVTFVLLQGPLILVNPVSPRCFLPSYLVLAVIVLTLAHEVQTRWHTFKTPFLPAALYVISGALAIMMLIIYTGIQAGIDDRLAQVRAAEASGSTEVTIAPLPYPYYAHDADPYWSLLTTRYKAYYGISPELAIELSPNPWKKTPQNPNPTVP